MNRLFEETTSSSSEEEEEEETRLQPSNLARSSFGQARPHQCRRRSKEQDSSGLVAFFSPQQQQDPSLSSPARKDGSRLEERGNKKRGRPRSAAATGKSLKEADRVQQDEEEDYRRAYRFRIQPDASPLITQVAKRQWQDESDNDTSEDEEGSSRSDASQDESLPSERAKDNSSPRDMQEKQQQEDDSMDEASMTSARPYQPQFVPDNQGVPLPSQTIRYSLHVLQTQAKPAAWNVARCLSDRRERTKVQSKSLKHTEAILDAVRRKLRTTLVPSRYNGRSKNLSLPLSAQDTVQLRQHVTRERKVLKQLEAQRTTLEEQLAVDTTRVQELQRHARHDQDDDMYVHELLRHDEKRPASRRRKEAPPRFVAAPPGTLRQFLTAVQQQHNKNKNSLNDNKSDRRCH